ncbi:response regulator [Salarchaeum japonicum]|uniref:response regulator n=1 Tax=Salarchaeum japonicum TaxID=555573 RepID=UPI003C73B72C
MSKTVQTFGEETISETVSVLVVDDDASLVELVETFLEREKRVFDVTTTTDSNEAITLAERGEVDAVVSDYDMPTRNGIELLKQIRNSRPDIPFILFTGKGSEEIASKAISAGVTDYLQKGGGSSQYKLLANRLMNAVEKHRSQRALEHSEEKFSKLVENSSDFIAIVSENALFEYASSSAESVIGYSSDELVGESVFEFVHPKDRKRVMEEFFRSVENPEEDVSVEFRLADSGEHPVILESRGNNLLDDDTVSGFVVNTRDITDLKDKQNQLEQRNDQLEHVQELIAHDVRTPLTAAESWLDLYEDEEDPAHLDNLRQALDRAVSLLDQTDALTEEPIVIRDLQTVALNETAKASWTTADTTDARLEIVDSRLLEANESQFGQLLENLFRNAIAHGDADTVRVGTLPGEDGFFVEDTGTGIPESERPRVFESGYTTGEVTNTGLGLVIVKQIANGHEWDVTLTESEEGGARFEFSNVTFKPDVCE